MKQHIEPMEIIRNKIVDIGYVMYEPEYGLKPIIDICKEYGWINIKETCPLNEFLNIGKLMEILNGYGWVVETYVSKVGSQVVLSNSFVKHKFKAIELIDALFDAFIFVLERESDE